MVAESEKTERTVVSATDAAASGASPPIASAITNDATALGHER